MDPSEDFDDEDDLSCSYTQSELRVRENYMTMLEENPSELVYDPKEIRETNPEVFKRVIGTAASFEEAFVKYLTEVAKIFFVVDRYDMLPLALDLLDHYMTIHSNEKLPFDYQSGRSATLYMDKIRKNILVQDVLATEEVPMDKQINSFFAKLHSLIQARKLKLSQIYQVELFEQKFCNPDADGQTPWSSNYDPEAGCEYIAIRVCSNAEGLPMKPHIESDYDFSRETFLEFLKDFRQFTQSTVKNPALLLIQPTVKSFSLDALDFCIQQGIQLYTFPPNCENLRPLHRKTIGLIRDHFTGVFKADYEKNDSLHSRAGVQSLLVTCAEEVFTTNKGVVKSDFCTVLRLHECLNLGKRLKSGKNAAMDYSDSSDQELGETSQSTMAEVESCLKKAKKLTEDNEEGELNELMFAQVGPLRESDYY